MEQASPTKSRLLSHRIYSDLHWKPLSVDVKKTTGGDRHTSGFRGVTYTSEILDQSQLLVYDL